MKELLFCRVTLITWTSWKSKDVGQTQQQTYPQSWWSPVHYISFFVHVQYMVLVSELSHVAFCCFHHKDKLNNFPNFPKYALLAISKATPN